MAARQDIQLEKLIEDLSKSRNLDERLFHRMADEGKTLKCSKHFLSKLDKLMCMTLDQQAVTAATLCLDVIGKHGKNLQVAGSAPGLVGIINQGLVEKMVQWFGKCRLIWIQCGPNWNLTLLNLCEDFLDTLIEVHGSCRKGTCDVSESFLYLLGDLVVDARIYILIRKEAIRKFNILLDKIPAALKKTLLSSKETSDMMIKLAAQILDNGDYDFQTALVESLCRMVTSNQRRQLADQWFCSSHVANAFAKICDSDFETDCRKFLNLINGMQGDMRRVYSYPCLETFLDKCELLMPLDNKLEDFWVDFNVGSHSISFYFCLAEDEAQGGQWETLSVIENEVESYSVTENGKSKVLKIHLLDVLNLGSVAGSSLSIHFSRSLDILQAVCRIFGKKKQKGFIAKKGTSVAKTEIHIQMVDNSSQAVIPESQTSLVESQNNSAPYCLPSSLDSEQATAKRRNSKSTTFIKSTGDGSCHKSRILSKVGQKRDSQGVPDEKAVEKVQEKQPNKHSQEDCVVPDTQPMPGQHTSTRWRKQSVSEVIMMPTQKMTSVPSLESCSVSENSAKIRADSPNSVKMSIPNSSPINQKMLHSKLTQKLQDVLNERNGNILPQDPPKHQNMVLNVVENYVEECFTSMAPQKEKNSLYTKTKGQQVKQNVPFEAKKQTRSRKSLQKKADTAGNNKEKRNAEVAGNMVKNISSHYEYNSRLEKTQKIPQLLMPPLNIRPVFNTSWSSNLKTEQFGGLSINKSKGNLQKERDDAFAFNVEAHSLSKQKNLKRNLFSDTDTENINTDVSWLEGSVKRPEIAKYCRQAPSKTKTVLTSRKTANHQDSTQASPMPIRGKPRKSLPQASKRKPRQQQNNPAKSAAGVEQPHVTRRRPSRAAAKNDKSYRELDTDDSQSATKYSMHHETDGSACWRKKTKSKPNFPRSSPKTSMDFPLSELKTEKKRSEDAGGRKSKTTDWTQDRKNQNESKSLSIHKLRPDYSPDGTERMDNTSLSFQEQKHDLKGPKASRCASGSASSSIEKVLHADRSSRNLALSISLPTSPTSPPPLYSDHPYNNSLSVTAQVPKPHSSVSSRKKVKSPCGRKKSSSIHSIHSLSPLTCHSTASLTCVNLKKGSRKFPPPPKSPTPHPPLTSTLLEQEKPLMPSPPLSPLREAAINRDCRCSFSVSSVVSQSQSSCRSSVVARRVMETFTGGNAGSHLQEKTCSNDDRTPEPFVSGPCAGPASSSESEAEKRKKNKSKSRSELRMKPRKLFKSFTELSAAAEMSQAMSITVSPKAAGGADEDFEFDGEEEVEEINVKPNICKQLNIELKKKCQMRSKMMELYNQQSLKTVQQHVSSFNIDVHKDRTQRLEEVEKILLGEIKKLEQEDLTLKTMEKDLILYWKKQSKSLHSYREQETKRNETLKTVLQGTMCQSLQYEERKFTSQMALMRKDMKSVQDRLMTDMQEKEIQNIKHSLHALFYPGGGGI